MRILLINRFFGGEQTPTGRMLYDLAKGLSNKGCTLHVLCSNSEYAGRSSECVGKLANLQIESFKEWGNSRITRWFSFWLKALFVLGRRSWDKAILLTDPPFLPFAAWLTRPFRRSNQQIFWWTMDIYPEALAAAGLARRTSLGYKLLHGLNENGIKTCTGVVPLGERQLSRLQEYRNFKRTPFVVVPPWDLRPLPRVARVDNQLLKRFAPAGEKVALYTGNLGEGHIYSEFLGAARMLAAQGRNDWKFVFVIRGAGRKAVEKAAETLPNLTVFDYFSESETAALLWSATVHLVSMKPGWEGVIVPSKLYGALKTDAPVLFVGPADADTALELQKLNAGVALSPQTPPEKVIQALDYLASSGKPSTGETIPQDPIAQMVQFFLSPENP